MSTSNEPRATVLQAVAEFNRGQIEAERIDPEQGDAVLVGEGGRLDSMGLVSLIVAVEEQLRQSLGRKISLADEKAFSQKHSPFRSLDRLVEYVEGRLRETSPGETPQGKAGQDETPRGVTGDG